MLIEDIIEYSGIHPLSIYKVLRKFGLSEKVKRVNFVTPFAINNGFAIDGEYTLKTAELLRQYRYEEFMIRAFTKEHRCARFLTENVGAEKGEIKHFAMHNVFRNRRNIKMIDAIDHCIAVGIITFSNRRYRLAPDYEKKRRSTNPS